MKKMVIYFSDIVGTIIGRKNNTDEDYQQFCDLLSQIKENGDADELIFSLISSDNYQVVTNVHKTMNPFIMQTVTYGRQFFDEGYYTVDGEFQKTPPGKAWNIAEYITYLSQNYEIVSVYYAEDVKMYHDLLSYIAEEEHWSFSVYSITPTKNIALTEVNKLLEISIQKNIGPHR